MSDTDEMKMTGLILAQSALVGVAVGVFSAGLWLPTGEGSDSTVNGMTYAMGVLHLQDVLRAEHEGEGADGRDAETAV